MVINTCSVRERAEEKLYTRLGELRQLALEEGPDRIVAVAGCVAQQEGAAIFKRAPGIADVVVGTQAIRRLPMLIEQAAAKKGYGPFSALDLNPYDDVTWPLGVTRRSDPVKAYVTIIEGCNEFCSFCVVPYTRPRTDAYSRRTSSPKSAKPCATATAKRSLSGQIVNHTLRPTIRCDFATLLERIHGVDGIERIRFASPHPRHVTSRFWKRCAAPEDLPSPPPAGPVGLLPHA